MGGVRFGVESGRRDALCGPSRLRCFDTLVVVPSGHAFENRRDRTHKLRVVAFLGVVSLDLTRPIGT